MGTCWPAPLVMNGEETHSTGSFPISMPILIYPPREELIPSDFLLVVWDIQTGIIIWKADTPCSGKVLFHGSQGLIMLIVGNGCIYTYDVLDGTQVHLGSTPLLLGSGPITHWTNEETLQFAVSLKTDGQHTIDIKELQPASTTPLHTISSFPIQPHDGEFSFSQASFHASFVTSAEAVVLDVCNSKLLLQTQVAQQNPIKPGQFSPTGSFFACGISEDKICLWQNTITGYGPWSSLRLRLPYHEFSFSPTSLSILCWGWRGVQLLNPGNHPSPIPTNGFDLHHQNQNHLVAYSTHLVHIATVRKGGSDITVLNSPLGTLQQLINKDMKTQDIKVVDNSLFVVDRCRLVSWDLEAGEVVDNSHIAKRVTVDEALAIDPKARHLTLSHDCSQIAFTRDETVFLHNLRTPGLVTVIHRSLGRRNNISAVSHRPACPTSGK